MEIKVYQGNLKIHDHAPRATHQVPNGKQERQLQSVNILEAIEKSGENLICTDRPDSTGHKYVDYVNRAGQISLVSLITRSARIDRIEERRSFRGCVHVKLLVA